MVEYVDGSVHRAARQSRHADADRARARLARAHRRRRAARSTSPQLGSLAVRAPGRARAFRACGSPTQALRAGGTAPAVLNAANEIAVEAFLAGATAPSPASPSVIEGTLDARDGALTAVDLDAVLAADAQARRAGGRAASQSISGAGSMSILHTVVSFLVTLGVLIVVHELGHYLVARLCGVKVLRFSVGFGRPLFVRRRGRDQTEWVVAAIPLGGYVKMLDEREGPVAPARGASRLQPPERVAAHRHRARGPGGQLPARDRALLGALHARPAGSAAGARRAAGGHARRHGRPARRRHRARDRRRRRCATWKDVRWRSCRRRCRGSAMRIEVPRQSAATCAASSSTCAAFHRTTSTAISSSARPAPVPAAARRR